MEIKFFPEIFAFCVCWLIQKGEMLEKNPQNILDKEGEKKDIVENLGLGWLLLILKSSLHLYSTCDF